MRKIAITKWNGDETDISIDEFIRAYLYQLDDVQDVARKHGMLPAYHHAHNVLVRILSCEFDDIYNLQQCIGEVNHG